MPDYNSDRERHADHKFIVQTAWPTTPTTVKTSKGELQMNDQGRMVIRDEALAREIQKEHPRDLAVTRMRTPKPADQGHRYHFGSWPAMPWKKEKQEATDGNIERKDDSNDSGNSSSVGQSEGRWPADGESATCEHG